MIRPCFLVVDREYAGSISTRKLVLETAKLNVITAYSSLEAIETLQRFPAVSGVVLDSGMKDMPCGELVRALRQCQPAIPIVVVGGSHCGENVQHVEHYNPQTLLKAISAIQPEEIASILEHDESLAEQQ